MAKHLHHNDTIERKKALFLGESYRADAKTWIKGLQEYGDFEVLVWEAPVKSGWLGRLQRAFGFVKGYFELRALIRREKPAILLAERVTSYGFLGALLGFQPLVIAQQGASDVWPPTSPFLFLKKWMRDYAYHKATLLHAWGTVMETTMLEAGTNPDKILVMPKGIDRRLFQYRPNIPADRCRLIVTRSLTADYGHDIILKAVQYLVEKNIPVSLTIIGDGTLKNELEYLCESYKITSFVTFSGRISNDSLPSYLAKNNIYISMPVTEGVSASLFEAMSVGCFPIVSDIPGNRAWIEHGKNGYLIPLNDAAQLATAIQQAFENPTFVQQVIRHNSQLVKEKADYEKNMEFMNQLYHQLISNNHVWNRRDLIPEISSPSSSRPPSHDERPGASRTR